MVTVNQIIEAFRKLIRRAAIAHTGYDQARFLAWVRSVEVTRNPETDLFMVHLPCILVVGPNYFRRGSKEYQLTKSCALSGPTGHLRSACLRRSV